MFLRKKGQSTAEYAILIGLVAAVAAGFLSVGLKGAVRDKARQATNFLMQAGNDRLNTFAEADVPLYHQEYSQTTVLGGDNYENQKVLHKGGAMESRSLQTNETNSVSIETVDANGGAN